MTNIIELLVVCLGSSTVAVLCLFFIFFDILCLMSLFYWKDIYEKCPSSDLINYMIMYLVIPYMFLDKNKVVVTVTQKITVNEENQTNVETTANQQNANNSSSLGSIIFYFVMTYWGISEFKVKCVSKLQHSMIYSMGMIVMICSLVYSVFLFFIVCCGAITGGIRTNPREERYRDYSRLSNDEV